MLPYNTTSGCCTFTHTSTVLQVPGKNKSFVLISWKYERMKSYNNSKQQNN